MTGLSQDTMFDDLLQKETFQQALRVSQEAIKMSNDSWMELQKENEN